MRETVTQKHNYEHITDEIDYYQQLEIGQGQREPLDGRGRCELVGCL